MSKGREPRMVRAGNRSPFTLDGTRTFLIGVDEVAVVDPGPDEEDHVRALLRAAGGAGRVRILLTHGHGDHAGAAAALARALEATVLGPPSVAERPPGGPPPVPAEEGRFEVLEEGDTVATDEGNLAVVEVPGHTRDHLAFHHHRAGALFVGDLVLGRGATTWLGEYSGCVADYLASLSKVEALGPRVLYPSHGPPVTDVTDTLRRFRRHRLERIAQVAELRGRYPGESAGGLVDRVYGYRLSRRVRKAAERSVEVMLHHLDHGEG